MKTRTSENATKLVATYQLSPFYFDRTGVLTPWTLSRLVNIPGAEQSDVFCIPGYAETVTSFLRYQEFCFQPGFYTDVVGSNSTLEVVAEIGHVGKTSYVFKGEVRLETSKESLCRFDTQLVHVDMHTRQPTALPQHLQQKTKGPRPTFSLPILPNTPPMYSCKFTVEESDIDGNGHTNQSVYIRLCSDTAAFGTKAGRYRSLSGDFLKYPAKKIAMLFQREALLGDVLEVQSWEILSKPVSLLFQVKREEDDIVRCLLELYEQERAKL
ncbi:PREDICTED: uncharacterized protein LOC109466503 [Branchiostoma belcheri]|uniref:Uncharacterized protein LOC109466503 n=1 Tax=Branchiostoma belcheri TaxID=7741 RepID=A0A6P4YC69_BRABE|nr:PREDICTED: uncharacterized protein LOC109466503 [Branchiostoma belcheri]